ncbi:hypothetical protein [Levilactobacillus enshiensis]|uniref:hypothetical protein n=1 Tax=Levilactobacillus enshiensis TaxID=2590213 RepID=UPI00117A9B5A|nr:hypothetical protein [Levilactobacillus enshiensis]
MRPTYLPKKELWVVDTPYQQRWRRKNRKTKLEKEMRRTLGWHFLERMSFRVMDGPEIGDIDWVMGTFTKSGLFFRFWDENSRQHNWPGEAQSFSEVLGFLAHDPKGFDVEGFESDYSKQELEFLTAIKRRYAELDEGS